MLHKRGSGVPPGSAHVSPLGVQIPQLCVQFQVGPVGLAYPSAPGLEVCVPTLVTCELSSQRPHPQPLSSWLPSGKSP